MLILLTQNSSSSDISLPFLYILKTNEITSDLINSIMLLDNKNNNKGGSMQNKRKNLQKELCGFCARYLFNQGLVKVEEPNGNPHFFGEGVDYKPVEKSRALKIVSDNYIKLVHGFYSDYEFFKGIYYMVLEEDLLNMDKEEAYSILDLNFNNGEEKIIRIYK